MMPESKIELILDEMINENKKDTEKGHEFKVMEVLKISGVKSEKDFENVMLNDWNIIQCSGCQNKIDIITAKYTSNGDIRCEKCGKSN